MAERPMNATSRAPRTDLNGSTLPATTLRGDAGTAHGYDPAMRRAAVLSTAVAVLLAVAVVGSGGAGAEDRYPNDDTLRLNEMQVMGTHNSFHRRPNPQFIDALLTTLPAFAPVVAEWDYEQLPLTDGFADQGVRQIELDVWADPDGSIFSDRKSYEFAGLPADPGIPELHEPGLKVLHIHEVDVESTCWTFVSCLEEVKAWSDANPGHAPLTILVEAKQDVIPDILGLGYAPIVPFGATELDGIDTEIRSVFAPEDLITPDDVRGSRATLEEAVLTDGWPTLGESRGKVLFALDNGGGVQSTYLSGHPSAQGRVLFPSGSAPGNPETAFIKYNDPIGDFAEIQSAVAAGYIVRTRADANPTQTNPNLFADRDQALASGAQFVSTDYPVPDPIREAEHPERTTPYFVQMPGGNPARCNPISGPPGCTANDIENPAWLGPEPAPTTTTTTTTTTTPGSPPGPTTTIPAAAPATVVVVDPRFLAG
jgi:hypothetical protein